MVKRPGKSADRARGPPMGIVAAAHAWPWKAHGQAGLPGSTACAHNGWMVLPGRVSAPHGLCIDLTYFRFTRI